LHAEKRTGVLRLYADAEHYKVLFFEHGQLLNVLSVPFDAAECLGRVLQRAGYLSQEKVIESLQRAKTSGHKQGEELLAMGAIRKDLLFEMLRVHIEVKMTAVMEWGGGRWTFHDTGDAPSRVTRIDLDLPRLLFNLLWKRYPGDQLQQKVRRFGDRFVGAVVNPPFDVDDFGFGDAFRKFCQIAMEKDNPLKRLLIVSNLKPDQSIRMIWAMHLTGMLGFFDESREDKSLARIEDLKNQLKVIERETLFDVLHVHWTATDHMVEKAYQQRTTELERALARASGLEEELNKTLLQHVKKAYATLKGRDSRREYRQVIYDDDFIVFNSDILRQKGESYLFTKDSIELAVPEFESALEVYDKNGEYWSELGLAYFVRDYPRNMQGAEEARRLIKRGLSMAPSSEIVHLCLGLMYRHEKKNKQAVEALERVLQINASNKFAKILIDEINTGVKSEDYEQVVKDFVDRRSQADKDFDKKMAAKKTDQEGKGRPGARQKAARKTKPSAAS
jgi:tetratricopeptide (TPR) repeat protein